MSRDHDIRDRLVRVGRSLFERGFAVGTAGNISVATGGGFLVTPTNSCLGSLTASRLSRLDRDWTLLDGDPPSKELPLHRAFYETRPGTRAIVHLHSSYATALSCLADLDADDCIPALTPYVLMRVGRVKLCSYAPPGSPLLADAIMALGGAHQAVLLANHGPVVSAASLEAAVYGAEELEEAAKVALILRGMRAVPIPPNEVDALLKRSN